MQPQLAKRFFSPRLPGLAFLVRSIFFLLAEANTYFVSTLSSSILKGRLGRLSGGLTAGKYAFDTGGWKKLV